MITKLSNEYLEVSVNSLGAELQSIFHKSKEMELLWHGDPEHWGRRSPVLFPFVGRLKEDSYKYEGKSYPMGQHGFARNLDFELRSHDRQACNYTLSSEAAGKKDVYPFDWELQLNYKLGGKKLVLSYVVINQGNPMFFSLGAHPAFNCPVFPMDRRSDYFIEFSKSETDLTQIIEGGLRTGERQPVIANGNTIPIRDNIFDRDALIFSNLNSDALYLTKPDQRIVKVAFEGFPYLGIWSKSQESPFVCIEPWFGVADSQTHDQNLPEKEGIIKLDSGQKFEASMEFEVLI